MKRKGSWVVIVGVAFLAAALPVRSAEHYKVLNYPGNFYFGHISYVDPGGGGEPVVLREGRDAPEPAILNLPVRPGDIIRTSSGRRLEVQFDTGTVVRLDFDTGVKVETILARSLSSLQELSNLTLLSGRVYVMYKEYNRREMFQILTANAAVKMRHNSVIIVKAAEDGSTEVQVALGRVRVLFGADAKSLAEQEVRKLERFVVLEDHQSQMASFIGETDFELWNRDVNARFTELHEGLTALPKPIQKLSPAVFYFAQNYGSLYGEWLWDDYLGYVWKPFIDHAIYPWGWQPYYYGQWAYEGGGMFWVPREPWGWVPYHLGIWHWDKKRGWVWIPGSLFAPAWVDWSFYFGYAAWRPWGLFDWIGGYGTAGFYYVEGSWGYDGPVPLRTIHKDQLKKPAAAPFPIPKDMRSIVKTVEKALLKQDARVVDSAKDIPRHLVLVPKGDLNSRDIHEKALSWDQFPKLTGVPPATSGPGAFRRFANPGSEAVRIFRGVEAPRSLPQRSGNPVPRPSDAKTSVAVPGQAARPDPALLKREGAPGVQQPGKTSPGAPMRFRDWNPDLKIARERGVRIEYSSLRNEVVCPELKLSSRDRNQDSGSPPRLTSSGVSGTSGGSASSGSSGDSASASTKRESEKTSSESEKGSTKSGKSEKIKK